MYPPDEPYGPQPPRQRDPFKIVASVVIGLLVLVIVSAITGGIGFWIGYSMNAGSAEKTSAATPSPTPTAMPSPTPTATPTPTPTPEVGGKYTGKFGDVEISDVTDKAFTFNISVGTTDAVGHLDGQATRTSPTVAVYSKIPDMELYNDPDSMYYKKKCRLTFRFSAGKLTISEDDVACNYWHGAAIDFNGTFSQAKKK
jgi:hypothetical protein